MYSYKVELFEICIMATFSIVIILLIFTLFITILLCILFSKYSKDSKNKINQDYGITNINLADKEQQLLLGYRKLDDNSKELVENTIKTLNYKSNL